MMSKKRCDLSVVLGSKNRKGLLKATIDSIRTNGFNGTLEIIVIDGGSTDGSCDWLAKQRDIFTIIQPNYRVLNDEGISVLAHSWGEFMNIGFKYATAPYIVMVSDDLILQKGCLQKGFDEMEKRRINGEKIGAGAFFFREYPRHKHYRTGLLPGNYIALNHGFYLKEALEKVGYLDENTFNFYSADGDIIMRLNHIGWKSIALYACFAEHLCHVPVFNKKKNLSPSYLHDMDVFRKKYPYEKEKETIEVCVKTGINVTPFYICAFKNVFWGYLLRIHDKLNSKK
jgi:glycosyltransferase involved in cell wall biosynthesis